MASDYEIYLQAFNKKLKIIRKSNIIKYNMREKIPDIKNPNLRES